MKLTESNYLQIALKYYDNPQCSSLTEIENDLKRIGYIQKLFNRYLNNGDLKERLILNHIIILFNVFGDIAYDMLFLKISEEYHSILVTFLVYLNRMRYDQLSKFQLDSNIVNVLRNQ